MMKKRCNEKVDKTPSFESSGYIPYVVFETTVVRYERYLKGTILASIGFCLLFAAIAAAVCLM
jgi:hypothetical protein